MARPPPVGVSRNARANVVRRGNEVISMLVATGGQFATNITRGSVEKALICRPSSRADARTRTGDPFITSEVLYQLSYVGVCPANRLFFDLTYAAF